MKSFKCNYTEYIFIICLKSLQLYKTSFLHIHKLYQKNTLNPGQSLISINTILNIRRISRQKKYRINNILKNYSSHTKAEYNTLYYKYIQNFKYQYKKRKPYNLKYFIDIKTKKKHIINNMAVTYIYILYKLLNSNNPLYIYYFLTQQRKKL